MTAQDAQGNTATGFTGTVTVALGANPGSGTLGGTTTVAAVAGVATFSDLSVNKSATDYTLTGAASGLSPATSAAFNVTSGTVSQLVFSVQPSNTTAGTAITPAVQVTAQDAQGNTATGFTGTVTVALSPNPGGGTLSGTTSVAAVNGVATFANLSINKVGSGYTLSATATGAPSATSGGFNITAGTASQLVFSVQPSNTTAGAAITPAVQVTAQDAQGNTATGFTGTVTVALGANGVATFSGLSVDKVGTGYTLTAAATGLTGSPSATFNITAGIGAHLVFSVQPSNTAAGTSITPAVQVTAQDGSGNTDPTFTGNVTVALGANPGGGTLSGTTTVTAVSGVATFSGLSVDKSGTGYTLTGVATGLSTAISAAFNVTAGTAAQLVFSVEPSNVTATQAITPAVQVTARDAQGNTATGFTGTVTVAIGANPGGGVLAGTTSVAAVSGVATFSNLSINKAGTGYTLTAAATGPAGAASTPFDVSAGAATHLAFSVPPSTTPANAIITPPIQVTALDAGNNVATGFSGSVTMAIPSGSNPGGGTLSGTKTVAAVGGVATFSDLSINNPGTGYRLRATSIGLTAVSSVQFNITALTQLVFTVEPGNVAAGGTITPAVQVTAEDAAGRIGTGFTGNVTVAIGANPGSGTLSGTTTVAAVSGVATFSTLSVNKAGTGYTLTAGATGLTTATSSTFNVSAGGATHLAFAVQPSNAVAGAAITPAVQLTAQDAQGNTDPTFTGNILVALGANPGGGTLSGTTTVGAVNGVAAFSTLSINKTGIGYTLAASATGITGATSTTFNITSGAAAQLVFTVQPSNTTSGAAVTPAVQVTAQDAQGNTATGFTGIVAVAIVNNPGGGSLSGTTSVAAVGGVATFSNLSVDKVGTGYTLAASATGPAGGTSAAFNITPGVASRLVFSVQPTTTTAGSVVTPAVQVTAQDAQGNTASGFSGSVTVAIGTNPSGGTLSGTTTAAAVAGVGTFSTLSIDKSGTGYTLTSSATGLTGTTSAAFNIEPAAANRLVFTGQPTNTTAGATFTPAVTVTAEDGLGNTVTSFNGSVTVAIGTNPSGGTLSGTSTVTASNGVASFSTLSINRTGTGYSLTASATGLATAGSAAFNVTAGSATALFFTVQPSNTVAGGSITPAVQVTAEDGLGNTVTSFTGNVTVAIGTNPSGGTLSGTTTVAAVNGVASFSTLSIDKAGTGYTLAASASGLTGSPSAAFNITAGAAAQLVFTAQPSNATSGAVLTPAVQVTALDGHGNTAIAFAGNVAVAIASNPGGGTLSGTTTVAAVNGVATFSTLSIDKVGTGYTFAASATGPNGTTSTAFNITPGAASHLVFSVQPTTTTAGSLITPAVQVTAQDAQGNTATGFTGNITVAIGANPGGGTLSGTATVAAVSGVATFSGLSINKAGTGYTLVASSGGLTDPTSTAFNITAGSATQLVFTGQPSNTTAGAAITPAVQVTAQDGQGNTATGFTGNVTVAIGTNPGGGTLSGTATVAAVSGVATFSGLSINKTGTGYTLGASSGGLTGTSSAFNITAGNATQLVFAVQPTTTVAGASITPAVQVTARDGQGNTATGFTG
ncbi:MAG: hemagglutinin, partial [Gemmatimonadetes bacterium]